MAISANPLRRNRPDDDKEDSSSHNSPPFKKPRTTLPEENDNEENNTDDLLGFFDDIRVEEYDDDLPSFLENLEFELEEETASEFYNPVVCPWLEEMLLRDQADYEYDGEDEADFGIDLDDLQGNVADFGIDLDDLEGNFTEFDLNELMPGDELEDYDDGLSLDEIISIPI